MFKVTMNERCYGQTHLNNLSAVADELFECVWTWLRFGVFIVNSEHVIASWDGWKIKSKVKKTNLRVSGCLGDVSQRIGESGSTLEFFNILVKIKHPWHFIYPIAVLTKNLS